VSEPSALADATRSVLLAVRLRPMTSAADLVAFLESMGLPVPDAGRLLERLELAGLVEHRGDDVPRWRLTDDGRQEGERLLAVELDGLGLRAGVADAYEQFVALNGSLLRACTDWQLLDANPSSPVANDHSDPEHDRAVIERLGAVHDAVLPACTDLAGRLGRFAVYQPRFAGAMARIQSGDHEAIDSPSADSYHAIWFELHDHLLATLGRDRSLEPLPGSAWTPPPTP
jgi:hypothetical protein